MHAAVPKIATPLRLPKPDSAPGLRLVVDNRISGPGGSTKDPGRPLPWAVCLIVWAVLAAVGWGAVLLLVHVI